MEDDFKPPDNIKVNVIPPRYEQPFSLQPEAIAGNVMMVARIIEERDAWQNYCNQRSEEVKTLRVQVQEINTKHEVLLRQYKGCTKEIRDLRNTKNELQAIQMENALIKETLKEYRRYSFLFFVLSLLAVIFTGFSINLLTQSPPSMLSGSILLVSAVTLEVLIFLLRPKLLNIEHSTSAQE